MKRIFTIVALLHCLQALGVVRYVNIAATGANNGSSWLNAATDLQTAINLSAAGDSIFVAAGTYQPVTAAMYTLKEGVKIFGGFPNSGNPRFADRNWTAYQTILRGNTVERLFGSIRSLSAQTVLDGCHLTGGSSRQGGLAYISSSNMKFSYCRFFDNLNSGAQGGIFYLVSGAPTIENCIFSNNNNTIAQGAVLYLNDCSPVITDCVFDNNTSVAQGGIIFNLFGAPRISNCVFSNNRNTSSSATIIECFAGGAPEVSNCRFLNNTTKGGLISFSAGTAMFSNCVFAGNNATEQVCILSTSTGDARTRITFAGCVFSNNSANNTRGGGIMHNAGNTVTVTNCTFSANRVSTTRGSSLFENVMPSSVFTFVNSIVYGNTGTSVASATNSPLPTFRYSIVQGMNDPENQVSGADPLFVSPANAVGLDNIWATADDGLELQPGSPAIDQGENASVSPVLTAGVNGGARIVNGTVDFGAYEYVPSVRPVVTTTPGATTYIIQQSAVPVDAGITVSHNGKPTLATATIAIGAGFSAEDVLSFTNAAGMGNITGSYNATTGQLTLVSVGGTATIAQWQAALRAVTYNNTNASPAMADRTISFIVNDGALSSNTATKTVTLQRGCQPTASTTNMSVCRAALPYLWNGQRFNTAGNHVVHLTNAAGCDSAATLVLTVNEATVSATQRTICRSELPFQWNGREYTQAGTYTVNLRNRNGCDSTATLELSVADSDRCLALRVVATPSGCNKADGTITATASGGTAPYQYSLDGVNYHANNVFTGLTSQPYNVSVKDADGTLVTVPITVTSDMCLNLVSTPAGCNKADGVVTATGSGGSAPYQYSIDGTSFQTSNAFTGLAAQSYNITMKDADGRVITVPITVKSDMCLQLVATRAGCNKSDGTITATASGGAAPYQYSLDGVNYQASNVFTGLPAKPYSVSLKDANGTVATGTVTVSSDMCLNLVATPAGCNKTDGVVTATGSGGSPPYQYSIDGINFQASNIFTGLAAQSYRITMKDANVSVVMVDIVVNSDQCLTLQVTPAATTCGQNNGTITAVASSGLAPYQYALNGGPYQENNVFSGLASGDYKVHVKDVNGLVVEVTANVGASVAGRVSAGNNTSILKGQPLQLKAGDVDNVGFNRFDWSPGYGLNRTDIQDPVATIDKDVTYTLTATDPNGCKGTAQVTIKVIHNADIYVPNAFTPNNDGRHDVLRALPVGVREFKFFAVYNRWGRRVFHTADPRYGWDGSVDGSRQSTGTFVWVTEGVGFDGSTISRKGTVTLIR